MESNNASRKASFAPLADFFLLPAKQLFHVGVHPGKLSTLNFQLMNQKQKLHLTKPTFDPASKLYLDLL